MEIGDIVQLKSGGPRMTVQTKIDNRTAFNPDVPVEVTCSWTTDTGSVQTARFDIRMLKKLED